MVYNDKLKFYLILDWMSLVVGKISPWIHVDSADSFVKRNSEKVMNEPM